MSVLSSKFEFFNDLGYKPHEAQKLFHSSQARFRVLQCGRRFGKTKSLAAEFCFNMLYPERKYWIVAPEYTLAEKTFREVYYNWTKYFPDLIDRVSLNKQYIKLTNGSELWGKSADNPGSLLGEGLHGLGIDEAARIPGDIWSMYLRPTLSDYEGWAAFISTPRPTPWFRELFALGQDRLELSYESWRFPTSSNPYIKPSEIDEAKMRSPERVFRQEWLAEDIDAEGVVFRNWRQCINTALKPLVSNPRVFREPVPGTEYVVGVDLAKYEDFTVITVINTKYNQVEFFDRFNTIDWTLQKQRIANVSKYYYDARVIIDASGVGDPIFEDLQKHGVPITPYKITPVSKPVLIDRLAVAIENKEITYPDITELCNELNLFQYKKTQAGNLKMQAPEGYHDDGVISLAMAVQGIGKTKNFYIGGF